MKVKTIIRILLKDAYGISNVREFREDIKQLVFERSEKFNRWDEDPKTLRRQIIEGRRAAKEQKWDEIGIIVGLISLFAVFIPYTRFNLLVAIFALLLTIVSIVHRVSVEILAYDNPRNIRNIDELKFMSAWNRGPLNSPKAPLIFIVALGMKLSKKGYVLGLWYIDDNYDE